MTAPKSPPETSTQWKAEGNLILREVTLPGDLLAARDLLSRAVPSDYLLPNLEEWMAQPWVLGIFRGETLLGILRLEDLGEGEGWLNAIRIAPEDRGRGLGLLLTRFALARARERGIHTVRLTVEEGNAASHALVKRAGGLPRWVAGVYRARPDPRALGSAREIPEAASMDHDARLDPSSLEWIRRQAGLLCWSISGSFRLVQATERRLREAVRAGRFWRGTRTGFLADPPPPPHPVGPRGEDRVREAIPLQPLWGPLEEILGQAARRGFPGTLEFQGFLPDDPDVWEVNPAWGLRRGDPWGYRVAVYEVST